MNLFLVGGSGCAEVRFTVNLFLTWRHRLPVNRTAVALFSPRDYGYLEAYPQWGYSWSEVHGAARTPLE